MNPHFEMIPCSSGELPEKSGEYPTSEGEAMFNLEKKEWRYNTGRGYCEVCHPNHWFKPIPAPEPIPEGEGVTCQKCGNRYRVDLMVPDALWNQIKPEGKENGAGLLCGHCIISAMEAQGYGHLICQGEAPTRMTLQEAKDEVAQKYGYHSWDAWLEAPYYPTKQYDMDEVYELLASGSSPVPSSEYDEAVQIASFIRAHKYPDNKAWEPLDTLKGVLSQISNMVSFLNHSPVQGEAMSWVEILNEFAFNFTEEQKLDYIKGASRYAKCAQLFMTTNREAYGRDRWKAACEAQMNEVYAAIPTIGITNATTIKESTPTPDFQP